MATPLSALNIAHKIELWAHIKRLGAFWQENDADLAEFGKTAYNAYKEDLEVAIKCFSDLADQAERLTKGRKLSKPAAS